ncbi:hypothetical protein FKW77_000275 [Venturia effusa]|uniref:Major facilitator superfamily (MFS) profile domain-containing protein n=1 Tax=Venturia effusa TaxID=50376 RepID=A0A517L6I6_9PEZI|nr:hypothetical protein FKW77_000275 [Venturia effusa]
MASSLTSRRMPKLPVAQLTILSICRFAEPVALTSVFPYLPEMIESFGIPRDEVAKWAGITSACFSISQCLTAISWGRASDKYGRKPIILLAMTCAMLSSLLFGFSRSLNWAIASRAFSGASNGNVGILRTTVAEMVPQRSLQARAFSLLPLVWQIGSIVGPVLGGALASPATKLPGLFGRNKFFRTFPFALPNLINGVIFTIGLLIGVLFLKESLATRRYQRDYGRVVGSYLTRSCTGRRDLRPSDEFEPRPLGKGKSRAEEAPRYRDVFSPQSNVCLLTYCILALHGVTYDQLLPVFLHLHVDRSGRVLPFKFAGGFGLESGRIGVLFTIYGTFSMICQFTLFPMVTQKYGALTCIRWCTFIFPLAYFVTPYTVLLPSSALRQSAAMAVLLVKSFAGVFAYPCITILMTNSAKSLQLLGTLNGVATSLSAIGRAIGPFTCGRVFTWGTKSGYAIAPWWLLSLFAVWGHAATWWLVEGQGFGEEEEDKDDNQEYQSILLDTNPANNISRQTGTDMNSLIFPAASFDENSDDDDFEKSCVENVPLLRIPGKDLKL